MTKNEMLGYAAKAVGYDFRANGYDEHITGPCIIDDGFPVPWNPYDDDGDSFGLAVDLRIFVRCGKDAEIESPVTIMCDSVETDPRAATRRAIVRAAAEIGRAME